MHAQKGHLQRSEVTVVKCREDLSFDFRGILNFGWVILSDVLCCN